MESASDSSSNSSACEQHEEQQPIQLGAILSGHIESYLVQDALQNCLYGTVYRGVGLDSGDVVAIKLLVKAKVMEREQDRDLPETPLAEIFFAPVLHGHPHLFAIREVFEVEKFHLVVSDLAHGEDLLELLKLNPRGMPPDAVRFFMRQAAEALHYAHSRSVALQDFSLENCLLFVEKNGNYKVRVCDPGQAVRFQTDENGEELLTPYAGCVGKKFRPPEVFERKPYMASKVDSWCLGWSCFYLLFATEIVSSACLQEGDVRWQLFRANRFEELFAYLGLSHCMPLQVRDFVLRLMHPDPTLRMSVADALQHPFLLGASVTVGPLKLRGPVGCMQAMQASHSGKSVAALLWEELRANDVRIPRQFVPKDEAEIAQRESLAREKLSVSPIVPERYFKVYAHLYCCPDKPSGSLLAAFASALAEEHKEGAIQRSKSTQSHQSKSKLSESQDGLSSSGVAPPGCKDAAVGRSGVLDVSRGRSMNSTPRSSSQLASSSAPNPNLDLTGPMAIHAAYSAYSYNSSTNAQDGTLLATASNAVTLPGGTATAASLATASFNPGPMSLQAALTTGTRPELSSPSHVPVIPTIRPAADKVTPLVKTVVMQDVSTASTSDDPLDIARTKQSSWAKPQAAVVLQHVKPISSITTQQQKLPALPRQQVAQEVQHKTIEAKQQMHNSSIHRPATTTTAHVGAMHANKPLTTAVSSTVTVPISVPGGTVSGTMLSPGSKVVSHGGFHYVRQSLPRRRSLEPPSPVVSVVGRHTIGQPMATLEALPSLCAVPTIQRHTIGFTTRLCPAIPKAPVASSIIRASPPPPSKRAESLQRRVRQPDGPTMLLHHQHENYHQFATEAATGLLPQRPVGGSQRRQNRPVPPAWFVATAEDQRRRQNVSPVRTGMHVENSAPFQQPLLHHIQHLQHLQQLQQLRSTQLQQQTAPLFQPQLSLPPQIPPLQPHHHQQLVHPHQLGPYHPPSPLRTHWRPDAAPAAHIKERMPWSPRAATISYVPNLRPLVVFARADLPVER